MIVEMLIAILFGTLFAKFIIWLGVPKTVAAVVAAVTFLGVFIAAGYFACGGVP